MHAPYHALSPPPEITTVLNVVYIIALLLFNCCIKYIRVLVKILFSFSCFKLYKKDICLLYVIF